MIVSLSSSGIKCQVGDFMMVASPSDSPPVVTKANLILYARANLPLGFPLPPEVVAGAGEYEISGVRIKGVSLDKETQGQLLRTVYSVELEGIRLAFLLELGEESVGEPLDKLGTVDILFLGALPGKTKAKQIATLIKQVDPKIIIPVGEKTAKLLAEELGQRVKTEERLVIKKKDLDKEQTTHKLVWLKS